ncbi:hypothetical protein [Corticicoccus populi]|uniref:Uncharacterized protein n=1 Tax=Corticicoccus populi TaxID=1812821 RepID=A0ABW5WQX8_9STAP
MTVLEMKTETKVKKIDYDEFIEQVKHNKFKVDEVDYDEILSEMRRAKRDYSNIKSKADKFNVVTVFSLFNELCAIHKEIIDIHTYISQYMLLVEDAIEDSYYIQSLEDEEIEVYRTIMKLRAYSAYVSNLAELSFSLLCKKIYKDEYDVIANDNKADRILGVDIVLLHKYEDVAHYVHNTKYTKFSLEKLKKKNGKEMTVIDSRIKTDIFNSEKRRQYIKQFNNHTEAFYNLEDSSEVVNNVYLFTETYVRKLIEGKKVKCDKRQYEELEYLEISSYQERNYISKNGTVNKKSWYE